MDWADLALSAARGASLATVLSAFGAIVFRLVILPGALAPVNDGVATSIARALVRLTTVSVAAAVLLTLAWSMMQSAAIAGVSGWRETVGAAPVVMLRTQFGHFVLARLLLLVAAGMLVLRNGRAGAVVTALLIGSALMLQPFMGHAGAMGGLQGCELAASEVLHLLAAGAWLGGLAPLLIVLCRVSPEGARAASHSFTPIGLGCVTLLAGTGLMQAWDLIGGLPGLIGTSYGRVALLKLAIFAALLGLAMANRFVLTERLASASPQPARRWLIASVATETVLGMAVVLAAGRLASLAPSIHEQPTWPFPVRPSLDAFADPDLAREVGTALVEMAGAVVLAGAALVWRRVRWTGLAGAVLLAAISVPHLDPLFVEAYPSSFYISPTEFGDTGIVHGARLFAANCAGCHGVAGHGDGPAAKASPIPPADLTAEHLWAHGDGDLFWWLSHGVTNPEGGLSMPGFAATLSSDARWEVIDYLHAHNAGESMRGTGTWTHPVPTPQFSAVCRDGRHIDLDDLRGRPLLVVAGIPPPGLPATLGLTVIQLAQTGSFQLAGAVCVAGDPATWKAFAILLGVSPDKLAGAQVLADQNGWLRASSMLDVAGGWIGDNAALASALADIERHPIKAAMGGHHH